MQSVLKISEAAAIALHSMTYLALHSNRPVAVREIAENFDISDHHLAKVMQRLVKAGLVLSTKGPSGGFSLSKNCSEITFLEIYEAIDGKISDGCCLFGKKLCECRNCIMGNFLIKTNKQVKEYFSTKKLSDFCKQKEDLYGEC